ncbi:MAG TPA: NADH:flavin oxidoreductase, partial [Anaerovoracaceae bacterium]|nr:NADH:flavin oxidoreductase [Anaerovoracaceae bacterium]
IFEPLNLKHFTLKNRIVMPAMVTFGFGVKDGLITDELVEYYAQRAAGGVGLIFVEAACIDEMGKLAHAQIGIWNDGQLDGHKKLTERIHRYDLPVISQLHHAGIKSVMGNAPGPSDFSGKILEKDFSAREMTLPEISEIQEKFIKAGKRARQAGYDGIEIHCAHSYLLCSFLSPIANHRQDQYGGSLENRIRLAADILKGIRDECGDRFIISLRMGYDEPDLTDSIAIAKYFETAGIDLLNLSTGFGSSGYMPETSMAKAPEGFDFNVRIWGASQIRQHVSCPVIAVGGVRQPHQAEAVLKYGFCDLAAVGRGLMCDPEWVNKINTGKEISYCRNCQRCIWSKDYHLCPGRTAYLKSI